MTSSSGSDDASGHSRRRRSPRSPEPADSSWADVVGVRGSWQDDDPGKNDPPGGFDAFGTGSAGSASVAGSVPAAPGTAADVAPARSDRRSGRRDQAAPQPDDVPGAVPGPAPGATPAAVNPNRPWWAGGGEGGPQQPSSPFQPGSAMSGGSPEPQRPAHRPPSPGGSIFEPVRSEPIPYEPPPYQPPAHKPPAHQAPAYETPTYEPPTYEAPVYEAPAYRTPPGESVGGRRTGYDAAPYDPSGYQNAEQTRWQPAEQPYQPPSYEPAASQAPTYQPPAYELPTYQQPSYQQSGYERPGHEPGGYDPPTYSAPVLEPPRFEHGDLQPPDPSAFAAPPARMPAPWDSPITGLPSLDEFTTALPAVPAAPVAPAPIIPAPPVAPATTDAGLPKRPLRSRGQARSDERAEDERSRRSVEARAPQTADRTGAGTGAEADPQTAAEIAAGTAAEPIEPAEPASSGREKSFNDVLTGSIPRLGRGRPRSSGRLGAKAKSPGTPPLPPVPAPSQQAGPRPGLDDDTTIFPGLGGPAQDEPDATVIRPPLRNVPDQGRTTGRSRTEPSRSEPSRDEQGRTGQPAPGQPRPDRGHEGPLRPDDPSPELPDLRLPGVPGPAPATGRAGRNLPAAIAVGVGLGALAVVSLFTRPEAFVAVVSVVAVLAVWELAGAMAAKDIMVPVVPLAVGSLGMLVSAFVAGEEGLLVSFTLTGFGVLVWRIIDGVEGAARDITAGLFVAAYVPLLAGFAILMLADGPKYVVAFILVTVASDIGGYVAGVLAGRHPMAPTISPKKTWEGFSGSVVACLGVGVVSVMLLLDGNPLVGLALGAATVVTATLGDLAESLLKRDLNVKDMGNLLPGHGGLMDRLDSLLPTAPVAFLILHMLVANS